MLRLSKWSERSLQWRHLKPHHHHQITQPPPITRFGSKVTGFLQICPKAWEFTFCSTRSHEIGWFWLCYLGTWIHHLGGEVVSCEGWTGWLECFRVHWGGRDVGLGKKWCKLEKSCEKSYFSGFLWVFVRFFLVGARFKFMTVLDIWEVLWGWKVFVLEEIMTSNLFPWLMMSWWTMKSTIVEELQQECS